MRTGLEPAGLQNIFNSYQNDFDKGALRDSGYIYGPSRPRTLHVGLSIHIRFAHHQQNNGRCVNLSDSDTPPVYLSGTGL